VLRFESQPIADNRRFSIILSLPAKCHLR
jgi:hypothetical protein